ncbi:MAG TPA: tyrosine-protein phosphatase [Phenylobacterium sp.]|nr:tyrosine-protein phosphatase [Phenylobacterium sp.]
MTRHIAFEGIDNFRDFGGYDTACGRGLKRGRLFRSANHSYATEADLQALRDLGVKVIVDLRRPMEREREPSRRWSDFDGHVVENDHEVAHSDWTVLLKQADELDGRYFFEDSLGFYRAAPYEDRHIDLFSRYFQALAQAEGGVLVHCAAGKDRTGMICALTHHLAGVHRDDTVADFLATNHPEKIVKRVEFLGPWIHDLTGRVVHEDALKVAVSVNEAYLDAAFETIVATSGSVDAYLEQVLGVDSDLRARIEERILG